MRTIFFPLLLFKNNNNNNQGRKKEKEKRRAESVRSQGEGVGRLPRCVWAGSSTPGRRPIPACGSPSPWGSCAPALGSHRELLTSQIPPRAAAQAACPASARSRPAPPPSFPGRSLGALPARPAVSSAGPSARGFGGAGFGEPAFTSLGGGGLAARTRPPAARAAVPWSATSLRKLALRGRASRPPAA